MRITNWAFNPRRALFASLAAVYRGGLEKALVVAFQDREGKRLEVSLSWEETKILHDRLGDHIADEETAAEEKRAWDRFDHLNKKDKR